jgi:hypothetical protein
VALKILQLQAPSAKSAVDRLRRRHFGISSVV